MYIGSFPPPFGGVTVKNALLYEELQKYLDIERLDVMDAKHLHPTALVRLLGAMLGRKGSVIIGLSSSWRRRVSRILYYLNRKKARRSILVVMGGRIEIDQKSISVINAFRRIYVETEEMKRQLESAGANAVSLYPNCRRRPDVSCTVSNTVANKIKAVFFSKISIDKGADVVLAAATRLPEIEFHFYGQIEGEFRFEFDQAVAKCANVFYHGVFDSVISDAYSELNKYDVHLLPTRYFNEGIPGVIPESKIAAIPTIASATENTRSLIEDGVDGVLLSEVNAERLSGALLKLANNPELLDRMKIKAHESAERFYIERYGEEIAECLNH